jgi:thiamine-phosphate pyrophosphorylase
LPWAPPSRFYPIVDAQVCEARGLDPLSVADACFRGGAVFLQLRVKTGSTGAFLALADGIVALAAGSHATVVVNDRADIARMAGAAGVHVGQDDLPPDCVRRLAGPEAVIGVSTHDGRQLDEALASAADYVAVGPIFDTSTKATGYTARGLNLVRRASGMGKPVVAIGGIDLDNARIVIDAGASAVAVITDLLREDPERRTRAYLAAL